MYKAGMIAMSPTPENLIIFNQLRDQIGDNARTKSFRDPPEGISKEVWESPALTVIRAGVMTANQHSETSEFWEAAREGKLHEPCDKAQKMVDLGLPGLTCGEEEVADEIIRALDKADQFKINVARAVAVKLAFNATRPARHGNKLA